MLPTHTSATAPTTQPAATAVVTPAVATATTSATAPTVTSIVAPAATSISIETLITKLERLAAEARQGSGGAVRARRAQEAPGIRRFITAALEIASSLQSPLSPTQQRAVEQTFSEMIRRELGITVTPDVIAMAPSLLTAGFLVITVEPEIMNQLAIVIRRFAVTRAARIVITPIATATPAAAPAAVTSVIATTTQSTRAPTIPSVVFPVAISISVEKLIERLEKLAAETQQSERTAARVRLAQEAPGIRKFMTAALELIAKIKLLLSSTAERAEAQTLADSIQLEFNEINVTPNATTMATLFLAAGVLATAFESEIIEQLAIEIRRFEVARTTTPVAVAPAIPAIASAAVTPIINPATVPAVTSVASPVVSVAEALHLDSAPRTRQPAQNTPAVLPAAIAPAIVERTAIRRFDATPAAVPVVGTPTVNPATALAAATSVVATTTTSATATATTSATAPTVSSVVSPTATSASTIDARNTASSAREAAARNYATRIQALDPTGYSRHHLLYLNAANDEARQAMVSKLEAERASVEKAKSYAKSVLETFAEKDRTQANEDHHFYGYYNGADAHRQTCDRALEAALSAKGKVRIQYRLP